MVGDLVREIEGKRDEYGRRGGFWGVKFEKKDVAVSYLILKKEEGM